MQAIKSGLVQGLDIVQRAAEANHSICVVRTHIFQSAIDNVCYNNVCVL